MMSRDEIEMIEAAGWLVLDLAEHLREVETGHINPKSRAAAKRKIQRELGRQEDAGDPLNLSNTIRDLVLPDSRSKYHPASR